MEVTDAQFRLAVVGSVFVRLVLTVPLFVRRRDRTCQIQVYPSLESLALYGRNVRSSTGREERLIETSCCGSERLNRSTNTRDESREDQWREVFEKLEFVVKRLSVKCLGIVQT
jgi:hypothetical protein